MKIFASSYLVFFLFISCSPREESRDKTSASKIAFGKMPNLAVDKSQHVHLVFGTGDSLMYSISADNGSLYSSPVLVARLPGLVASHMRGPQISVSEKGVTIIACSRTGDIFSFHKDPNGGWMQTERVNDTDTVAKEGFLAMSADGDAVFAVWLDLREKHNEIYGAKSFDGGRTWSKNIKIYASPDSTVCECCKPSVIVRKNNVFVMFRNWLDGNRDLYLVQSSDGGNSFGQAQKLGQGHWKLNGCPMDGGGLAINDSDAIQSVWRRQNKLFVCEPGKPEREIGEGKAVVITSIKSSYVYAWTQKSDVVTLLPNGRKEYLGKGSLPILATIDIRHVICVWENDGTIYCRILATG